MAKVNPIRVQRFLGGVDYPARKQKLIEHAQSRGADDDVRSLLERLPDEEFRNPAAVSQAVSRVA